MICDLHGGDREVHLFSSCRLASQTKEVGSSTLQQLHEQGEQMDRIARDNAKVKSNLDT